MNILDHSTGQWRDVTNAGYTANGTYTINGLNPYTKYTVEIKWYDNGWIKKTAITYTPGDTPSFTTTTTATSISVTVIYPSSTAWGNRLCYYNGGWHNVATDYYITNRTHTVSNLAPNTEYTFEFWYRNITGDGWVKTVYYVRTNYVPETWQSSTTANLKFSFEPTDLVHFTGTNYTTWKNRMQTTYTDLYDFTGKQPYNGNQLEIKSFRDMNPGYWAIAGNPIKINQAYAAAAFKRINNDVDWSFGVMHELGHVFTDYRYNFDSEFWANFMMYHTATTLNGVRVYVGSSYYTGAQLENYYYNGHSQSYLQTVANGTYHHDGLLYTFIKIQKQIGWEPFKKAIAFFNNMTPSEIPATPLDKLNTFLSKLQDYSGYNVFSALTATEWNVYDTHFGGRIDYVDTKTTLVLVPGLMGSRLYYNGDKKWEPTTDEALLPLLNTTFMTQMKPYLLSNENGQPLYTLDPTRRSDNSDYGAQDAYEDIYLYLKNTANFPASDYKVKFFTYDWRLSSADNAELLERYLLTDNKVILIAHSMGGLVSSAFLARSIQNQMKVKRLITFGTPYMGAAKAMIGFESGALLGLPYDLAMSSHLKEICKNTITAYELLPTSRYGKSVETGFLYNGTSGEHTYANGRSYLATRDWAKKANGTVKPMLANSESFHNSLMYSGQHIANYFTHSYIVGTEIPTPSKMVYYYDENYVLLNYVVMTSGDGTVPTLSASNGSSYIEIPAGMYGDMAEHGNLVKSPRALAEMKAIITGIPYEMAPQQNGSNNEPGMDWVTEGSYVSVVLQGAQNTEIYDSVGRAIIQDGQNLFVQKGNGELERIGCIWTLDQESLRFQYILKPGSYSFDEIDFDESIPTEALYMAFNKELYTANLRFSDFGSFSDLSLDISTDSCIFKDNVRDKVLVPTRMIDAGELPVLNSDKAQ